MVIVSYRIVRRDCRELLFKLSFINERDVRLAVKRTLAMTRKFNILDWRAKALEMKDRLEGLSSLASFPSTRASRVPLEIPKVEAQSRSAIFPRHAPNHY